MKKQMMSKVAIAGLAIAALGGSTAISAPDAAPPGRAIAYVFTEIAWPTYQAKDLNGKETLAECPEGINDGAREQFAQAFPQADGKKWRMEDTTIAREAEIWFPTTEPDKFPFHEASGKIAYGLNLDGKIKPTDFTSPTGATGVDNQFFRAAGCILSYRDGSSQDLFEHNYFQSQLFNRILFEVTDVDSLVNDDDVTVTTYRGMDPLVLDAKGGFQPGVTERIDNRWSKDFTHTYKAKIVDGVLMTTPGDFVWPTEFVHQEAPHDWMRDARFEVKLMPDLAEGLIGGYIDIETYYRNLNRRYGTHQISYGKTAAASLYKALYRLADAHPDPKTGQNTAISATLGIKATQVRIIRPDEKIATIDSVAAPVQVAEHAAH